MKMAFHRLFGDSVPTYGHFHECYERVWDGINNLHISAVILPIELRPSTFLCLSPDVIPTLLRVVLEDTTILKKLETYSDWRHHMLPISATRGFVSFIIIIN